jgi:hypothetical protein
MRYVTLSIVLAGLIHAEVIASPHAPQAAFQTVQAPNAAVLGIMPDAAQALLWDGNRGEYVVVRVGDSFHQYLVSSISPEHVVLTSRQGEQHFVLPRTSDTTDIKGKRDDARGPAPRTPFQPSGTTTDLLDPYPAPVTATIGDIVVLDPYGTQGPINSVTAPSNLQMPINTVSAPSGSRASAPSPITSAQPPQTLTPPAPDSAVTAAPQPAATPAPAPAPDATPQAGKVIRESHTVSRREFDSAVMDFHSLSKEIQIELARDGVRIKDLAQGSLFHRWGVRAGDVVLRVDEQPIRGVDDAAAAYARLMGATRFVVEVKRGADTVILAYQFKK